MAELYRRDCRPNTLRTLAVTIISFLVYLKSCGVDRLEALNREDIGGFVEHEQDRGLEPNSIFARLRGVYSFMRQWLAKRSEQSAYLFHGIDRSRLGYEAVRCRFERYLGQAGLSGRGYTLHSLRHNLCQ